MKRYNLVYGIGLYDRDTGQYIRDQNDSEWVKYEPWMDEAEKQHKEPVTVAAQAESKPPTICVKCKNKGELPFRPYYCLKESICFVTGNAGFIPCDVKNRGNCPDFDKKEP